MIELLADAWIIIRENPITMGVLLGAASFILCVSLRLIWKNI